MVRARFLLPAALVVVLAAPAAVWAQASQPAPVPAQPTQAQLQLAAENYRVLVSALQSDKVPPEVKSILFTCSYSNPFSKISEGTDRVINEKKLDRKNPGQVLSAMAAICGYRPEMASPPSK